MYNLPAAALLVGLFNLGTLWRVGAFGLTGVPPRWSWNVMLLVIWAILCLWVYTHRDTPENELSEQAP